MYIKLIRRAWARLLLDIQDLFREKSLMETTTYFLQDQGKTGLGWSESVLPDKPILGRILVTWRSRVVLRDVPVTVLRIQLTPEAVLLWRDIFDTLHSWLPKGRLDIEEKSVIPGNGVWRPRIFS